MFLRKSFQEFLVLHSAAEPLPSPPLPEEDEPGPAPPATLWLIDWRWFCEPGEDAPLPSERSLIDWPTWARPKTLRRESNAPR